MHKWRPAHFFGQNPSINPAVVSKRISGYTALGGGNDTYTREQTFEASDSIGIGGDTYESDFNATMTFLMGKLGFATNIGSLYFGVMGTLVIMNIDQESQNNNPGQVQPDDDGGAGGGLMVGAGAGIRTNNLHLEIGVEKPQVILYRPK